MASHQCRPAERKGHQDRAEPGDIGLAVAADVEQPGMSGDRHGEAGEDEIGRLEMRLKLFDFNSYLLPGTVGLIAFNDIGRGLAARRIFIKMA